MADPRTRRSCSSTRLHGVFARHHRAQRSMGSLRSRNSAGGSHWAGAAGIAPFDGAAALFLVDTGILCPSDQRALISTRDLLDAAGSGGSGCVMLPSSQEVATSRSRRRTGAHAIRSGRHAAAVDPFAGATAACVRIPPGQRARRVVNRLFFRMREGFRAASVLGVRSRRSTRRRTT